jgi:hypothetical protein
MEAETVRPPAAACLFVTSRLVRLKFFQGTCLQFAASYQHIRAAVTAAECHSNMQYAINKTRGRPEYAQITSQSKRRRAT